MIVLLFAAPTHPLYKYSTNNFETCSLKNLC